MVAFQPSRIFLAKPLVFTILAVLLLGFSDPCLLAQVESGSVAGTVQDASGAIVAGASVTVTNTDTNIARQVTTNAVGEYVVTPLKVGVYSVKIQQPGFKTSVQTGIKLDVNQVVRIDFTLVAGEVAQRIEVTAAEPLVEADTSSIGQVIDESRVHELPLNGRNFITLAYLSPGVNSGPTGIVQQGNIPENERDSGAIQVNGLTATNNNYLLNGFDNNEQQIGFELIEPPIDAIQEFKVQTSNMSADIGKGGAVVNLVLKSGTNEFHGSAFEFLRNEFLDANNYFNNAFGIPRPPYRRNEFGGTLGGPIIKGKTFFFVDYQGRRVHTSLTDISTVPLLPVASNFSGPVTDPRTGQSISPSDLDPKTTTLPACTPSTLNGPSCLDPVAVNAFLGVPSALIPQLFPAPLQGTGVANNFAFSPLLKNNQDSFDVRVDHQLVPHNSFFATFSYGNVDSHRPDPLPGFGGSGLFTGNINNKALMGGLSDVHTFSTNKINELKIGYTRYLVDATPFFTGQDLTTPIGFLPGSFYQNSKIGGLPGLWIPGYGSGNQSLGNGDWFPEHLHENNYQLLDAFTYVKGNHSFKMGGDLRRRMHGFFQTQSTHGDIYFTGQFTGNALADFLLGYAQGEAETGQTGLFGMRWWEFSSYFLDDWRMTPKLTLNLGARYDVYTPQVEEHNRLANFDFSTGMFIAPGVTPGVSRSGNVDTRWNNVSPRIGFAYTPWNSKTVLRGGFGTFYDLQADQNDSELAYGPGGVYGTQNISIPSSATQPSVRLFQGFAPLPFPTLSNPSGRASAYLFHNKTTNIEEWSFDVERQLMKDSVLQVGYVGTRGVHLLLLRDLNQAATPSDANFSPCWPALPSSCPSVLTPTNGGRPYYSTVPNVAQIRTEGADLNSHTHSFQVRFEKRMSSGWSMLNSYTYQHTIGQAEEDEYLQPQNPYNMAAERGNVAPDFRHQFTSAWSYQLPIGPGRRFLNGTGPLHWIVGGWQANGIISMFSGQHFTPLLSRDYANVGYGGLGGIGMRPDATGNPYDFTNATVGFIGADGNPVGNGCPANQQSNSCWFNPGAFALPPFAAVNGVTQSSARQFGNATRGSLVGPAVYNTDFSLFKDFRFAERVTLQLRAELFNLFNTPQFAPPAATVDVPGAGTITNTVNTARQIQLAARVTF
jgi:Carboxypeptidase regulatory-like domain